MPLEKIENKILLIRGQKVMLDRDLAMLYGVTTKRLNEQVKRNIERFPSDFMFRLTKMETEFLEKEGIFDDSLRSQFATLKKGRGKHIKYFPYVFTEQGVAMLSSVLKSKKAVETNILIMRTFVKIRKLVYSYKDLADKIMKIEKEGNKKFTEIFRILDILMKEDKNKKVKEIGFKC
ncbi:ORF6N domain-containing protein [Candidatus Parcubacteria bacterium]|nr:ORF6N domain-containing protein [Candidatus Parcubacteria bacterium]